jgi:hypothetical protein
MGMELAFSPIPRVGQLTYTQFRQEFDEPQRPVVMTGCIESWPAMREWSHEWFKAHHPNTEVHLSLEETHTQRARSMRMGEYIEAVLSGQDGGLYMDQFPFERIPGLARHVTTPYCHPGRSNIDLNLWIGPAGTFISLHKDNHSEFDHINNIFAQIRGRKRVVLVSPQQDALMYPRTGQQGAYWHSQVNWEDPDYARFPLFRQVRMEETIVHPGDLLFIPGNYWHSLRSLDLSISVSCWWHKYRIADLVHTALRRPGFQALAPHLITLEDIEEFGGVARFAQALVAKDLPEPIRALLWTLASEPAREALAAWRASQPATPSARNLP